MKLKYIALALVAAMSIASFSACNDNSNTNTTNNSAVTNEQSIMTDSTPVTSDSDTQAPDDTSSVSDTQESGGISFVRGVYENNTYTGNFGDIVLKIPEGMIPCTDEELAPLMGITYKEDTFEDNLNKVESIFDFVAYNDKSESISIVYEKTKGRSVKEYIAEGIEVLSDQEDLEIEATPIEEISCAGKTYMTTKISITISENVVYQRSFAREINGYMINISVMSADQEMLDDFINNFIK